MDRKRHIHKQEQVQQELYEPESVSSSAHHDSNGHVSANHAEQRALNGDEQKETPFILFGIDFGRFPPWMQAVLCWLGVMVCHGSAGVAQQYIVEEFGFRNTLILGTSIPFSIAVIGFLQGGFKENKAPLRQHAVVGILSLLTIQFSNWALLYLNYVTQVIFKSSKIIPVMIIGTALYKQRYPQLQYAAAVLLSVGLTIFVLADAETSPNFHPLGVLIISLALFADAFIGNYQEFVFKRFGCSFLEASAWPALFSIGTNVFLMVVFQGATAFDSLRQAAATPGLAISLGIYGIANYAGVWFVLAMIKHFGAAQTVFATSMRKAGSIAMSYILFPKLIILRHIIGILLVSLGIYLHSLSKSGTDVPSVGSWLLRIFFKSKSVDKGHVLPV
eukprot:gb/GECG01002197.1/.p1 GENE.gb/GECG01002197.1/~~gb/GECG01002197.1/.p1  ORF type:complete len:389 (+),score=34.15 gb/GECG01002197.1/:1-1167(+)